MLTFCSHLDRLLNLRSTCMGFNKSMRNASANNTGNACYSELIDNCQHSRLKAALGGHLAPATTTRRPQACGVQATSLVSDGTKAYLWVAGMSVASLLSIVVSGTITA
jgi:hypothetical protein